MSDHSVFGICFRNTITPKKTLSHSNLHLQATLSSEKQPWIAMCGNRYRSPVSRSSRSRAAVAAFQIAPRLDETESERDERFFARAIYSSSCATPGIVPPSIVPSSACFAITFRRMDCVPSEQGFVDRGEWNGPLGEMETTVRLLIFYRTARRSHYALN